MTTENGKAAATSSQLTQQLGEVLGLINQLRGEIDELTMTAESDADHQQLIIMRSRLDGALAKETRLRAEIAEAIAREQADEQESRWLSLEAGASVFQTKADVVGVTAELFARQVDELLEAEAVMRLRAAGLPVPRDWPAARFTRDLASIIGNNLFIASGGRIQPPNGAAQSPFELQKSPWATVVGAAREFIAIMLRDRRQPPVEPLPPADAPEAVQAESTTSATGE